MQTQLLKKLIFNYLQCIFKSIFKSIIKKWLIVMDL